MGRRFKRTLLGGAGVAVFLTALSLGAAQIGATSFNLQHPGFVEQNRALRDYLLGRPHNPHRDAALATVEANLRWAAKYQRLGFDPEAFENMAYDHGSGEDHEEGDR